MQKIDLFWLFKFCASQRFFTTLHNSFCINMLCRFSKKHKRVSRDFVSLLQIFGKFICVWCLIFTVPNAILQKSGPEYTIPRRKINPQFPLRKLQSHFSPRIFSCGRLVLTIFSSICMISFCDDVLLFMGLGINHANRFVFWGAIFLFL